MTRNKTTRAEETGLGNVRRRRPVPVLIASIFAVYGSAALFLPDLSAQEPATTETTGDTIQESSGEDWGAVTGELQRELGDAEQRIRVLEQDLERETLEAKSTAERVATDIKNDAERTILLTQTFVGFLAVVLGVATAFLTLILGIATLLGWRVFRNAQRRLDGYLERARAAAEATDSMRLALKEGWEKLALPAAKVLPALDVNIVTQAPVLNWREVAAFEDYDQVLLIADKLNVVQHLETKQVVREFCKLGLYWRLKRAFPRAIARYKRAIEADPDAADAHLGLGMTWAIWATVGKDQAPPTIEEKLEEALAETRRAQDILGSASAEVLHQLGWVYDEKGDYDKALEFYDKMTEAERQESKEKGRDPNWNRFYNRTCTLAKTGRLAEALTALEEVGPKEGGKYWRFAEADPDFELLRSSELWMARKVARDAEQDG